MPRRPVGKRSTSADGATTIRGKAANGEGSLYFHEGVQAWRASYEFDGGRRWVQAKTRELAVAKRDNALADGAKLRHAAARFDAKTKVGDIVEAWLSTVARHRMRVSTWRKPPGVSLGWENFESCLSAS